MNNHGTALSEGQLAEFVGAGAKALTLIANQLGPVLADSWARNSGAMQKAFLSALCPLEAPAPFAFERNEHGHITVTVTGLDLTGAEEIERLEAAGYRLSNWVKSCLLSKKKDSYDKNHRLVANRVYKVALMPGKEIERDSDRTTENLRKRGMEKYGYGKPLGGLIPRIRESVSDKQMEEMPGSPWYIAGLHDPIDDSDGGPRVLLAHRLDGVRRLYAYWVEPGLRWLDYGLFAFPVPAS